MSSSHVNLLPGLDVVEHEGQVLAVLVRQSTRPSETTFPCSPELAMQVGFVVYPKGGEVARHRHLPLERHLVGTSEVLVVREGACEVDIYDHGDTLMRTWALAQGDSVLILGGGHALRMTEDTVIFEVKQGPYTGIGEKERF